MCGRYSLTTPEDHLVEVFDVPPVTFDYRARYNIAPSQNVPVVASDRRGTRLGLLRWGFVPAWADDVSIGSRMINARAESLLDKAAFKRACVSRRCLVPADGFYEWAAEGGRKVPYWIHSPDREPMGFAGIWERWHLRGREPVFSMAIITVDARPDPAFTSRPSLVVSDVPCSSREGALDPRRRILRMGGRRWPQGSILDSLPGP